MINQSKFILNGTGSKFEVLGLFIISYKRQVTVIKKLGYKMHSLVFTFFQVSFGTVEASCVKKTSRYVRLKRL